MKIPIYQLTIILSFTLFVVAASQKGRVQQQECNRLCIDLSHSKCRMCYEQCLPSRQVTLKECTLRKCMRYQNNECVYEADVVLSEDKCLEKCCDFEAEGVFNEDKILQCVQANKAMESKQCESKEMSASEMLWKLMAMAMGSVWFVLACCLGVCCCCKLLDN